MNRRERDKRKMKRVRGRKRLGRGDEKGIGKAWRMKVNRKRNTMIFYTFL